MPVGTRAAIKYLSADDYAQVGAQIVLGNTYHLMLRPGADLVERFGGLGRFAGWDGLTLTDSGGFQVFSLDPKVDDDGVTFKSIYDGSSHRFTPEIAVDVQQRLGADIQMVLDVCPPLPSAPDVIRSAVERTSAWAHRAQRRPRAIRPGAVRHRAGWSQRGAACGERPPHRGGRLRRIRHRRVVGGRDARGDAARARRGPRRAADRSAALPDGGRRSGVARRGGGARRRPVRLRDADAARPARHGAHLDGSLPGQGGAQRRTRRAARHRRARATSAPATAGATSGTCSRSASRPRRGCCRSTTSPGRSS